MNPIYYQYYVEGQCEEKLIQVLKEQKNLIISGKVSVLNPVQNLIRPGHVRSLKPNTVVILVFDTDKHETKYLDSNIRFLKSTKSIKEVWCVTQVKNLEDELLRSTDVTYVRELTNSLTDEEFKSDMLKSTDFYHNLQSHGFSIDKLWCSAPDMIFKKYENHGNRVKLKK